MKLVKVVSFSICLLFITICSFLLGAVTWYLSIATDYIASSFGPIVDNRQWRLAMTVGVGGVFWLREFFYVLLRRAQ